MNIKKPRRKIPIVGDRVSINYGTWGLMTGIVIARQAEYATVLLDEPRVKRHIYDDETKFICIARELHITRYKEEFDFI